MLNERAPTAEANLAASVLYRSLALKRARSAAWCPVCFQAVRFLARPGRIRARESSGSKRIEREFPLAGMPYGLPGLDQREFDTVTRWLAVGAPYQRPAALPAQT